MKTHLIAVQNIFVKKFSFLKKKSSSINRNLKRSPKNFSSCKVYEKDISKTCYPSTHGIE